MLVGQDQRAWARSTGSWRRCRSSCSPWPARGCAGGRTGSCRPGRHR